jgi:hypothetical protein
MSEDCLRVGCEGTPMSSTNRDVYDVSRRKTIVFLNPQLSSDCSVKCQLGILEGDEGDAFVLFIVLVTDSPFVLDDMLFEVLGTSCS